MTIRDLLDQVELQGKVEVQELTDNGNVFYYRGSAEYLKQKENCLDREITYIYPIYSEGSTICIEIK